MKPLPQFPRHFARAALAFSAMLCVGFACAQASAKVARAPAVALQFQDFFRTPIGPKGLEMTDKLRQANGQPVRLVGYMVQQEESTPGQFLLTPRPVQMSEHADGEADDLPAATVLVYLPPDEQDWSIPHARGLVEVSGTLQVGRHEGVDGRIYWIRLRLVPTPSAPALQATAAASHP
jgi:hypothetical protein